MDHYLIEDADEQADLLSGSVAWQEYGQHLVIIPYSVLNPTARLSFADTDSLGSYLSRMSYLLDQNLHIGRRCCKDSGAE